MEGRFRDRIAERRRQRGTLEAGRRGGGINLIIDATALDLYPFAKPGFHGGTELYVHKLAHGLADKGHLVHVVCADLEAMEMRGPTLFYWPKRSHPDTADAVVMVHNLENLDPYAAPLLIWASNGLGADLGPNDEFASGIDAVACFSQCHIDLLCKAHPIKPEICHVTGLGVELADYFVSDPLSPDDVQRYKVPGRMLYANDPQRGLWHVVDIFERVQKEIPDASLHISYDFDRTFANVRWGALNVAEVMWECAEKIRDNPGITNLGALTREQVIREQLECQVHVMPSDPPNIGSQIHGIAQMELAAAGAALVLSDTEAFPEVFGEGADILPLPGFFDPRSESRWTTQDYAEVVIGLMQDQEKWIEASRKARALAERNTWGHVVENWQNMLMELTGVKKDASNLSLVR